jgi:protein-S-isoprenylcysteine O-methyltransferase Ste14
MKSIALALVGGYTFPNARRQARAWAAAPVLADTLAKLIVVTLFSALAYRLANDWLVTGHVTGLLLLASESLVVAFTLVRRAASTVDRSWTARLLTGFATFGPNLVTPVAVGALAADEVTFAICGIGLAIVVLGKLSLGRSFGLQPANRGIVSTGLYNVVRHPIYLGYLFTHAGFVLANPAGWNLFVIVAADIALMLRAVREEKTLVQDEAYRSYTERVRWRVIPGVF